MTAEEKEIVRIDPRELGTLIEEVNELNKEITVKNDEVRGLKEQKEILCARLLQIMDSLGTTTGKAQTARVTVTETVHPVIEDDENLIKWISEEPETRVGIFQRRLNKGHWEDAQRVSGEVVPGIGEFVKREARVSKLPNT